MASALPQTGERPLAISDREHVEAALGRGGFVPSEYCFANLFLFRRKHAYRICSDPVPHLRGVTYDGEAHALPLGRIDAGVADALLRTGVSCLYPFGPETGASAAGLGLASDFREEDSDYWYDAARLSALEGTGDRRRQSRAFERAHEPTLEDWSPVAAEAALDVLQGWLDDVGRNRAATDFGECAEAVALAGPLGMEGRLVRTGSGEPVAFLLASLREDGVRVVHFAKGRRAFSHAYPWMFARFAGEPGAKWCNFEQDLGNPGLARSKRNYGPAEIRPKLRLRRAE